MKLYLAGPMTGVEHFNFPAFAAATEQLRAVGHDVLSPHEVVLPCGCSGLPPQCGADDHAWAEFMRSDLIAMLEHAQGVALLPGWERSRGATVECRLAEELELEALPVEHWLARPVVA